MVPRYCVMAVSELVGWLWGQNWLEVRSCFRQYWLKSCRAAVMLQPACRMGRPMEVCGGLLKGGCRLK